MTRVRVRGGSVMRMTRVWFLGRICNATPKSSKTWEGFAMRWQEFDFWEGICNQSECDRHDESSIREETWIQSECDRDDKSPLIESSHAFFSSVGLYNDEIWVWIWKGSLISLNATTMTRIQSWKSFVTRIDRIDLPVVQIVGFSFSSPQAHARSWQSGLCSVSDSYDANAWEALSSLQQQERQLLFVLSLFQMPLLALLWSFLRQIASVLDWILTIPSYLTKHV